MYIHFFVLYTSLFFGVDMRELSNLSTSSPSTGHLASFTDQTGLHTINLDSTIEPTTVKKTHGAAAEDI